MNIPVLTRTNLGFPTLRFECLEDPKVPRKFTVVFYCYFLSMKNEWFFSFQRFCQSFHLEGRVYFIVRTIVTHQNGLILSHGAAFDLNQACDVSCYYLSLKLRRIEQNFMMPKYLIGYPNRHGCCYLISAILPFLHSFPFISRLFDLHFDFILKYINHELVHTSEDRFDEEVPFYWVDLIFRVFAVYQDISNSGVTSSSRVFPYPNVLDEDGADGSSLYKRPIQLLNIHEILDDSLVQDLNASLVKYCSDSFTLPGGDERQVVLYLITKLASEIPNFHHDFCLSFACTYTCMGCSKTSFNDIFHAPIIHVPPTVSFQDLLDDPMLCFSKQKFRSIHISDQSADVICNNRIQNVIDCSFRNVPEILIFAVNYREVDSYLATPKELVLIVSSEKHVYVRLSSSVCFHCYKGPQGQDYGGFYHPYKKGDVYLDEHTYLQIQTQDGFLEVNNGKIYEADPRVLNKVTPGSVHFYQLAKYSSFVPSVHKHLVSKNPLL